MEFLSLNEIGLLTKEIRQAVESLLSTKALVGKPQARQWKFFSASVGRLLDPHTPSEFKNLPRAQAAQFKFEVEDKLRRFYLRPGRPVDFVFSMVHRSKLASYRVEDVEYCPQLAGYCLLVRHVSENPCELVPDAGANVKAYLERVVAESIDAEFRAYLALPQIETDELHQWFCLDSPAIKEILNLLSRHQKKRWIISNPMNPSTKRLLNVKVKRIEGSEAFVNTMEYWYLRWWDDRDGSYTYPYRETNRQVYILRKELDGWKVFENLRPSPRTSTPHRRKKRQS